SMYFYDGAPEANGTIFDVETIPHVRPFEGYTAQGVFRPRECGVHELFAVARRGSNVYAIGETSIHVELDPVTTLRALENDIVKLNLSRGTENSLLAKLKKAEKSFAKGDKKKGNNELGAFINEVKA